MGSTQNGDCGAAAGYSACSKDPESCTSSQILNMIQVWSYCIDLQLLMLQAVRERLFDCNDDSKHFQQRRYMCSGSFRILLSLFLCVSTPLSAQLHFQAMAPSCTAATPTVLASLTTTTPSRSSSLSPSFFPHCLISYSHVDWQLHYAAGRLQVVCLYLCRTL